jgi:SNF2 family DNA or RNA helicase
MMIANIVDGMPEKKDRGPKTTTLIVATTALVIQWLSEIKKHVRQEPAYKLKVMIFKKSITEQAGDPVDQMEEADIVLTTYEEVRKSYPRAAFPIHLQTAEDKQNWWRDYYNRERGSLHKVEFLRVV